MKLKSLEDLRKYAGLKPLEERKEKPVTCKKCGAEMKKVGVNVWICEKELIDKNGNPVIDKENKPKLCLNTYIRHIA